MGLGFGLGVVYIYTAPWNATPIFPLPPTIRNAERKPLPYRRPPRRVERVPYRPAGTQPSGHRSICSLIALNCNHHYFAHHCTRFSPLCKQSCIIPTLKSRTQPNLNFVALKGAFEQLLHRKSCALCKNPCKSHFVHASRTYARLNERARESQSTKRVIHAAEVADQLHGYFARRRALLFIDQRAPVEVLTLIE